MKNSKLLIRGGVLLFSLIVSVQKANSTELTIDHLYRDLDKTTVDEVEIAQHFASGFKLSGTVQFAPENQANGDSGLPFQSERWYETKLKAAYSIHLDKGWVLEPGFSFIRKQNAYKYRPFLKVKKSLNDTTNVAIRYRKEITDKSGDNKKVDHTDLYFIEDIDKATLAYRYSYYHGNQNLYDHSRHDYEHKIELDYKLTKMFSPYISFANKSVGASYRERQTEVEVGLSLKI
ncbi:MAG: oligogalacturonate-specific porin KdgM family protein [Marinomonas sp.]